MMSIEAAIDYARQHTGRFENQLEALLRIPSVSTMREHAADVERAAAWLVEDMRRIGLDVVETHQTPGYLPLVYGEWHGGGVDAPTVLIYGHYDVQPASLADGWSSDPFEPVRRDGRLFARGALDSKMHVVAHLKAVEALIAAGGAGINIKLLFEGEEESGSAHIFQFVADHVDKLRADVVVISDGSMPDEDQPVLVYGLRGLLTMEIAVKGPGRDLHSGHYGGLVHNPIQALAEILAALHDADGRVTVPGFYDAVRPLSADERTVLRDALPWVEREWQAVTGAPQPWGEPGFALNERMGARPTLEINGIRGGYAGEGFKTVLPSLAVAKVSCRLVPDQDPAAIFTAVRDAVLALAPPTVTVDVRQLEAPAPGVLIDRSTASMQAAVAAYERGWGVRPILTREGGSVPVATAFQAHLPAEMVLMPFGYKGGGAHSIDEYAVLSMFHRGIRTVLHFYDLLAVD